MADEQTHPEQVPMAGGAALSSKIPPWHLIPVVAMDSLAKRMQLGIERKGFQKSWNAISPNQHILLDRNFLIDRCGHIMRHAALLRDKLNSNDIAGLQADDDAGAILWGGTFLACATDAILKSQPTVDPVCPTTESTT